MYCQSNTRRWPWVGRRHRANIDQHLLFIAYALMLLRNRKNAKFFKLNSHPLETGSHRPQQQVPCCDHSKISFNNYTTCRSRKFAPLSHTPNVAYNRRPSRPNISCLLGPLLRREAWRFVDLTRKNKSGNYNFVITIGHLRQRLCLCSIWIWSLNDKVVCITMT